MATNSSSDSNSEVDPLTGQPKKPAGSVINGLMGTVTSAMGATTNASVDPTPAEAAAAGLGWVDRNHPLWGTPGFVGSGGSNDGATGDPQQYQSDGVGATGDATGDPQQPTEPEMHYQGAEGGTGGWPSATGPTNPSGGPQEGSGGLLGAGAGGAAPPVLPDATGGSTDPQAAGINIPGPIGSDDVHYQHDDIAQDGTVLPSTGDGLPTVPIAPMPAPTVPTTSRSADMDALVKQLQARATQSTVVDGTDPNVRRQADAFSAQQERARREYLADQAEGNSPYSTGAQAGLERMTAEKAGQASGQFESELINRELTTRRSEIQNALESMGNILTDEEKNGLQRELSNLNASLETAKMNTQNNQFFAGLNQEDKQFLSQLTQNERFKGMDDTYRRMELAQNQSQFVAKLAQEGKLAELDDAFRKAQLSQQDSQFLKNLAQQGKFAEMEDAYKKLALSQDQNQFVAKLAQEGRLAEMDDLFRRMKLMQEQSQFLDRLGFDTTQQQNYWDWMARGNGSSS